MATQRDKSTRWRRVREAAYERDRSANAPCWICGKPIDYRAPSGTPDAWEPDHYLPVCDYPEHQLDLANIRPSHASCNRARGSLDRAAKQRAQTLGERSRDWLG